MYVSVNKKSEVKEVGVSTNPNLTSLYINDDDNPFVGWSDAKICCYKVKVVDGVVMMLTPYVDSNLIEHFDALGLAEETNTSDISDTREGLIETFDMSLVNTNDISDCREAIIELYGMISE